MAFSPDGRRVASGGDDEDGAAVGRPRPASRSGRLLLGHTELRSRAVAFSPDGRRIASAGADTTVRLWDVRRQAAIGAPLTGRQRPRRPERRVQPRRPHAGLRQ